jgi:hypothetical protein
VSSDVTGAVIGDQRVDPYGVLHKEGANMNTNASIARAALTTFVLTTAVACGGPNPHVIETQVDIEAPASVVWDVLTDFEGHEEWDPFFSSLEGTLEPGETLEIVIGDPADGGMAFSPEVLIVETNAELRWVGHLLVPGVFDGEHAFLIVARDDGGVRFLHEEEFRGPLVPLFWGQLDTETRAGFEDFNAALKAEAEARAAQR